MNKKIRKIIASALLGFLSYTAFTALPVSGGVYATSADFPGTWRGTLAVGDNRLRLVFNLHKSNDGEIKANIDSPDQGATGIKVAKVTVDGDSIKLDISVLKAEYEGRLAKEGKIIEGEWRQSGYAFPLNMERIDDAQSRPE